MKPMTILPVRDLDLISHDTHYMALMHLVQGCTAYLEFYKARAEAGCWVTLDDSAVECPGLANTQNIIETALSVRASEIVLPDILGNKSETLKRARKALDEIRASFGANPPFKIMACPQGEDAQSWLECASAMLEWTGIDTVGISYTTTKYFAGRAEVLEILTRHNLISGRDVHLLGCFNIQEARLAAQRYPFVRSVDSAISAIYAKQGLRLDRGDTRPIERDIDFLNENLNREALVCEVDAWKGQISGNGLWIPERSKV